MIIKAVFATLIVITSMFSKPFQPQVKSKENVISSHVMSLEKRYSNSFVNDVFKDNILLTLHYLNGEDYEGDKVDWNKIDKPYNFDLKIQPNSVFAFHDGVLPQFEGKVAQTTNVHFNSEEGFKSDGYLVGDGVCHLASLINWSARDAGLDVTSPTAHDFANIPQVPKEFGVSIFAQKNPTTTNLLQNLYIKNNFKKPVVIKFNFDGTNLKVSVVTTG